MDPRERHPGPVARASFEVRSATAPVSVVEPRSALSTLVWRPAMSVEPSCSLADAAESMRTEEVSALLVGHREGIVTERDLTRALGAGCDPTDPVASVMSRHPLSVAAETSILAAAGLVLNEQVRHLIVELGDDQVGIVSIRDLLAALLQAVDPQIWLTSLRVAVEAPSRPWPS